MKELRFIFFTIALAILALSLHAQTSKQESIVIETNADAEGPKIMLRVKTGPHHNHPMMAVWIEDIDGRFLQTLYVNESVGKGYFNYADKSGGKWKPGELIRPASLPVWAHSRGIQTPEGHYMPTSDRPVPDAITSATPEGNFILDSKLYPALPDTVILYFETNQSWDWNEYWTNSKYEGDKDYNSSAQPSVVYATTIFPGQPGETYTLKPIGHGHHSGDNGKINPDLSTITTALQIFSSVKAEVKK